MVEIFAPDRALHIVRSSGHIGYSILGLCTEPVQVPDGRTGFGVVLRGSLRINRDDADAELKLGEGMFFSLDRGTILPSASSSGLLILCDHQSSFPLYGGPVG